MATEIISNKGTNGEPVTYADGKIASGIRIIVYHTGGENASDGDIYTTTTDSNGEYAFTDSDLPATYVQGETAKTDYVHLFAEMGSGGSPRQATPIRPWQGYELAADFPLNIDSFEDGDLSEYTIVGNDIFGVDAASPIEGSGSLEIANSGSVTGFYEDLIYADATSLDSGTVPQKGDVFSCLVYEPDKSTATNPNFGWGGDSSGVTGYTFIFAPGVGSGEIQLRRLDGAGSTTTLASDSNSAYGVEEEAFEAEIEWHDGTGSEPDNTIVGRLYELDSNLDRIQQVGSDIKATDSTYSSQTEVFFAPGSSNLVNGLYADRYKITGGV